MWNKVKKNFYGLMESLEKTRNENDHYLVLAFVAFLGISLTIFIFVFLRFLIIPNFKDLLTFGSILLMCIIFLEPSITQFIETRNKKNSIYLDYECVKNFDYETMQNILRNSLFQGCRIGRNEIAYPLSNDSIFVFRSILLLPPDFEETDENLEYFSQLFRLGMVEHLESSWNLVQKNITRFDVYRAFTVRENRLKYLVIYYSFGTHVLSTSEFNAHVTQIRKEDKINE